VRDGLMDVKRLQQVNVDGLEQWRPVLKAPFPLDADAAAVVRSALGAPEPAAARGYGTLDELLDDVVRPSPDLLAVDVHKRRARYTIDGCMAELTDVRAEGATTRTIAVESEDAELVVATLVRLGIEARRNVSFARGLKALVGFGAGRYATIDVGTNSVKFHIGERNAEGTWHPVLDRAEITRLGEGLQETGRCTREAVERTVEAIAGMAAEAERNEVRAIAAVGTAGVRMAANADELADAVRERSGVVIESIGGEEEARLAYLAATWELGLGPVLRAVFDTGGGSSQFTFGHGEHVEERFSVNVGAVRFTEAFGLDDAVSDDVLSSAVEAIAADLGRLDGRTPPDALVGIGGANTNLAAVKHGLAEYDPDVVQGTVLDAEEVDRQIELYRARSAEERRAIVGLQPQRADIILAGACIVRTVMRKLGRDSLVVSDRGLRHGLLVERFG
jgi:exopolyphosphatase/guanosine-5'-triphosphate,3'-diphosphate pyrophosphatase